MTPEPRDLFFDGEGPAKNGGGDCWLDVHAPKPSCLLRDDRLYEDHYNTEKFI